MRIASTAAASTSAAVRRSPSGVKSSSGGGVVVMARPFSWVPRTNIKMPKVGKHPAFPTAPDRIQLGQLPRSIPR